MWVKTTRRLGDECDTKSQLLNNGLATVSGRQCKQRKWIFFMSVHLYPAKKISSRKEKEDGESEAVGGWGAWMQNQRNPLRNLGYDLSYGRPGL